MKFTTAMLRYVQNTRF